MPRRKPLAQRNNKKKPSEDKLKQHKQKRFAVWRPSGPNRGFFPPFQLTSVHPSIMIHATEEDRIYHVFPYDERMNVPPGARVNAMPGALCDGRVVILVPNPIKGDNQDQDLHLEAMAVMWRPRVAGAPAKRVDDAVEERSHVLPRVVRGPHRGHVLRADLPDRLTIHSLASIYTHESIT